MCLGKVSFICIKMSKEIPELEERHKKFEIHYSNDSQGIRSVTTQ